MRAAAEMVAWSHNDMVASIVHCSAMQLMPQERLVDSASLSAMRQRIVSVAAHLPPHTRAPSAFFFQYLGACRRQTPRTRVDLKVPTYTPFQWLPSGLTLPLGVRHWHNPQKLLKMDPHSGVDRRLIDEG